MNRIQFTALSLAAAFSTVCSVIAGAPIETLRYVDANLSGEFGPDINAPIVEKAIDVAVARKANAIVFTIDSPGGAVEDARAIATILDKAPADIKVVVIAKRAISASIWMMAHADLVVFVDGGVAGAAVAYSRDQTTGDISVDAKMNSAIASSLASSAERSGQSGAAYRAMVIPEVQLFAIRESNGSYRLVNEEPTSSDANAVEIDSKSSVLTFTAIQAQRYGFAKIVTGVEDASIGRMLGAAAWEPVKPDVNVNAAIGAVRTSLESSARKVDTTMKAISSAKARLQSRVDQLPSLLTRAEDADPAQLEIWYYDSNGLLTPESQVRWRNQSDTAIRYWRDVQTATEEIRKLQKATQAAVDAANDARSRDRALRRLPPSDDIPHFDYSDQNVELEAIWRQSLDQIKSLTNRRTRYRVGS